MAVTLTADIDLLKARDMLTSYRDAASDLSPLMDNIGMLLETSTKDRIKDTNEAPDGVPWSPSFRSAFDGGKILTDSGRLGDSITHLAGPNSVEIGTNVIYAGIHQTGGIIEAKNGYALAFSLPGGGFAVVEDVSIPARPYLGISQADEENIGDAVVHHFEAAVPQ